MNRSEEPSHLHGDVPGQVDVGPVLIHPDLSHAESVTARMESYVAVVGLLDPRDVSHPGTGQHLHAASTEPHLHESALKEEGDQINCTKWVFFSHFVQRADANGEKTW